MCRNGFVLVAFVIAFAAPAADADAQTLPPPVPSCVIGRCHEEKPARQRQTSCPLPATLVCAGGSIIGGAAKAGAGLAGDVVMGGLTSWVAGGAAWLLDRAG